MASSRRYYAELHALAKTMERIRELFVVVPLPLNLHFFLRNAAFIQAIQTSANKNNLASILINLKALSETYAGLGIHLVWFPHVRDSEAQEACKLAPPEIKSTPLSRVHKVFTEAYCRDEARKRAFKNWATDWLAGTPSQTHLTAKTTLFHCQNRNWRQKQQKPTLYTTHNLHGSKTSCDELTCLCNAI
ncbi:hypothetical protein B0F90DRAFT_1915900, partial [Multifurca ochricompacta]